jgi:SAM-dependent methyltransferase
MSAYFPPPQWLLVVIFLLFAVALLWAAITHAIASTQQGCVGVEGFTNAGDDKDDAFSVPSRAELRMYDTDRRTRTKEIYDRYYCGVYQQLIDRFKESLVTYEVNDLIKHTRIKEYGGRATVLDLGCGTGQHLIKLFAARTRPSLYGVDVSKHMLDRAQPLIPARTRLINASFDHGDALDARFFTHITCYYFSFYYSRDYRALLKNVHTWLVDGGYFCVHLVDIDRFDPVIDAANPFVGISLQKYMKKRKTTSTVVLTDSLYTSTFEHKRGSAKATFKEQFIYKDKQKIRENVHTLHMPNHAQVVDDARAVGFRLRHITPLYPLGYEYQYICYLQKSSNRSTR